MSKCYCHPGGVSPPCWPLLHVDAVGIERRHRVAARLLVLVGDRAKSEHRVVNPLWRVDLASDEGERIERARHQRRANVVRALDQPIFMADASIKEHAMDEFRPLIEIIQVLIAD